MRTLLRGGPRKADLLKTVMALVLIGGLFMESVGSMLPLLFGWAFFTSPLIAMQKGYAPYYWPFACGPIGLIAMIFLPPLKSAENPEDYERLESRANFIGAVLSWIGIFIAMTVFVLLDLFDWLMGLVRLSNSF